MGHLEGRFGALGRCATAIEVRGRASFRLCSHRSLLASLCLLHVHTFTEYSHQVKLFLLQVNPFALEIVIDDLLLLVDGLGAAGYFLEEQLHHVHLTDG